MTATATGTLVTNREHGKTAAAKRKRIKLRPATRAIAAGTTKVLKLRFKGGTRARPSRSVSVPGSNQ